MRIGRSLVERRIAGGCDREATWYRCQGRMDCFASLAMTANTTPHSRGAMRPKFCIWFRPLGKSEGAGKTGCALHPRSRVQIVVERRTRAYRFSGDTPAFPAQWLYGLCRALPGDEFVLSPSSADMADRTRLDRLRLRRLDISNGCRDHTVLPYASAPFVCMPPIAHGPFASPPYDRVSRPTLPRPPLPAPTFVTMANAPLNGTGWQII
jgi:hypothetical protein